MGSEVRYRRQVGERRGDARGNVALCLVPLYGVTSLKEKNVEIFNNHDTSICQSLVQGLDGVK